MSVSEESVELQWGIPEEYRQATALLFDEAVGTKFVVAVRDTETRVKLLAKVMRLEHGLGAFRKGELVGGFDRPADGRIDTEAVHAAFAGRAAV